MPIYEYECKSCHHVFEEWQSILDEPKTTCPDCSGTLKKIISMSSFALKGGGWYADGYSSVGRNCKASSANTTSCGNKPAKKDGAKSCAGGADKKNSKASAC